MDDLKASRARADELTAWLDLALDESNILEIPSATANIGVMVSGPVGVGNSTLVRTVCKSRRQVELDGRDIGALRAGERLAAVCAAVAQVREGGGVLLITDVDALLPSSRESVSTLILTELSIAVATKGAALVSTTAAPEGIDTRLRTPHLFSRQLELSQPDSSARTELLDVLLRGVPLSELRLDQIGKRTTGFVVGDLAALIREAVLRTLARASANGTPLTLEQGDLTAALSIVKPLVQVGYLGHRHRLDEFAISTTWPPQQGGAES